MRAYALAVEQGALLDGSATGRLSYISAVSVPGMPSPANRTVNSRGPGVQASVLAARPLFCATL